MGFVLLGAFCLSFPRSSGLVVQFFSCLNDKCLPAASTAVSLTTLTLIKVFTSAILDRLGDSDSFPRSRGAVGLPSGAALVLSGEDAA